MSIGRKNPTTYARFHACQQPTATNRANHHIKLNFCLIHDFINQGGIAIPNIRMIKWRNVDGTIFLALNEPEGWLLSIFSQTGLLNLRERGRCANSGVC